MGMILVGKYHPETYEFLFDFPMDEEKYIKELDSGECIYEYDKKVKPGYYETIVYNKEKKIWECLKDYREYCYNSLGEKIRTGFGGYYLVDEGDEPGDPPRYNTTFGELPDKAKLTYNLHSRYEMIDRLLSIESKEFNRFLLAILTSGHSGDVTFFSGMNFPLCCAKDRSNDREYYYVIDDSISDKFYNHLHVELFLNLITRASLGSQSAKEVLLCNFGVKDEQVEMYLNLIDKVFLGHYNYYKQISDLSYKDLYYKYNGGYMPEYIKDLLEELKTLKGKE